MGDRECRCRTPGDDRQRGRRGDDEECDRQYAELVPCGAPRVGVGGTRIAGDLSGTHAHGNSFVLGETILVGMAPILADARRPRSCLLPARRLTSRARAPELEGGRARAHRVKIDASTDKHDGARMHSVKAPTQRGGAMNSPTDVLADDHTALLTEITPTDGRTRPSLTRPPVRSSVDAPVHTVEDLEAADHRRRRSAAGLGRPGPRAPQSRAPESSRRRRRSAEELARAALPRAGQTAERPQCPLRGRRLRRPGCAQPPAPRWRPKPWWTTAKPAPSCTTAPSASWAPSARGTGP